MNKTALVIIVLVVIIGGYLLLRSSYKAPQPNGQPQSAVPAPGQENVPEAIVAPDDTEEPLPNQETTQSAKEINMVSGNLFFSPDELILTKDQPVKIVFQNSGSHTFTIDQLGVDVRLQGSQEVVEFTPSQSGTFEYYCAVPGHWEGGMFGTLIVE